MSFQSLSGMVLIVRGLLMLLVRAKDGLIHLLKTEPAETSLSRLSRVGREGEGVPLELPPSLDSLTKGRGRFICPFFSDRLRG